MTDDEIDHVATVVIDLISVGADFYPPLAVAVPVLSFFVKNEAAKLKTGLASGVLVPDGRGALLAVRGLTIRGTRLIPTVASRTSPYDAG